MHSKRHSRVKQHLCSRSKRINFISIYFLLVQFKRSLAKNVGLLTMLTDAIEPKIIAVDLDSMKANPQSKEEKRKKETTTTEEKSFFMTKKSKQKILSILFTLHFSRSIVSLDFLSSNRSLARFYFVIRITN